MAKKVAKVGIKKEKGYLYFVDKAGDVSCALMARGNKKGGKFYKGNIFVFAWRGPVLVAHPYLHRAIGADLTNFKGSQGKEVTKEYMRIAKEEGSGWVDYWFPKPGEKEPSLKTTYVLKVDDNFYVCAGYFK